MIPGSRANSKGLFENFNRLARLTQALVGVTEAAEGAGKIDRIAGLTVMAHQKELQG